MTRRVGHGTISFASVILCLAIARTSDAARAPITILSPAGGEVLSVGEECEIRLARRLRARKVTIELSRDGGAFEEIGTINKRDRNRRNRRRLLWVVTGPESANCVIRATGKRRRKTVSAVSPPFLRAQHAGERATKLGFSVDGRGTALPVLKFDPRLRARIDPPHAGREQGQDQNRQYEDPSHVSLSRLASRAACPNGKDQRWPCPRSRA